MRTRGLTCVLAAFAAAAVLAGGVAASAATPANEATGAEGAEIAGVQTATVAPDAAIAAAEARVPGRAVAFGLEKTAQVDAYQVTVARGGGAASSLQLVQVDPATGKVLSVQSQPDNALADDGLPAADLGRARDARVTLDQAVRTAEASGKGRALEAGYVVQGGRLGIEVDVVAGQSTRTLHVDPGNGEVIG